MPETTKPKVPRGPNAERRAATRAKIMEAAVGCLAEFGYAATSTPLVAKMAKVSRGSLLHQFPTKVDLILAVAEYAARAQAMRRDWQEVVLDLNAALQLSPRRADLLVLRASARRALKNYQDALADTEAALKLSPGDGSALVERGLLRRQLGDMGGARRDFQAALKTASGSVAEEAKANLDDLAP